MGYLKPRWRMFLTANMVLPTDRQVNGEKCPEVDMLDGCQPPASCSVAQRKSEVSLSHYFPIPETSHWIMQIRHCRGLLLPSTVWQFFIFFHIVQIFTDIPSVCAAHRSQMSSCAVMWNVIFAFCPKNVHIKIFRNGIKVLTLVPVSKIVEWQAELCRSQ